MRNHSVQGSCPTARRAVVRTAAALAATTGLLLGGASAAGAMTHPASTTPITHTAAAKPTMVPIAKNTYMPASLTVGLGQAVTWTNEDDAPHTVTTTSAPVKFDSGTFAKDKSFTYTFTQPGVYKYYCAVHPDMVGTVTVTDKPAAPAAPAAPVKTKHKAKKAKAAEAPAPAAPEAPKATGDNSMPGMGGHGGAVTPSTGAESAKAMPADGSTDPITGAYNPFMKHMEYAHFNRGPGQQVEDISEFDTWAKNHEALFRMMLDPEIGPASALGSAPLASTFFQHMDAAHWNRSPMGQANDIADFDTWNKSHIAMFRMMLDPVVGKNSALGTSPGTSVFMQHMDAAHWNKSVNGQVTDITDNAPAWTASHQAMITMMASSLSGGSNH